MIYLETPVQQLSNVSTYPGLGGGGAAASYLYCEMKFHFIFKHCLISSNLLKTKNKKPRCVGTVAKTPGIEGFLFQFVPVINHPKSSLLKPYILLLWLRYITSHHGYSCRSHRPWLEYRNVLYVGLPLNTTRKLSFLQCATTRMVLARLPRYHYATPDWQGLHWLPVVFRVKFKLLTSTYKVFSPLAEAWLVGSKERDFSVASPWLWAWSTPFLPSPIGSWRQKNLGRHFLWLTILIPLLHSWF